MPIFKNFMVIALLVGTAYGTIQSHTADSDIDNLISNLETRIKRLDEIDKSLAFVDETIPEKNLWTRYTTAAREIMNIDKQQVQQVKMFSQRPRVEIYCVAQSKERLNSLEQDLLQLLPSIKECVLTDGELLTNLVNQSLEEIKDIQVFNPLLEDILTRETKHQQELKDLRKANFKRGFAIGFVGTGLVSVIIYSLWQ